MKKFIATIIGFGCMNIMAQNIISGRVIDALGNPLPGASVEIIGTKRGSITDSIGFFEINNTSSELQKLRISYIGFEPIEFIVGSENQSILHFQMKEAIIFTKGVTVYSTRANDKIPTTYTNIEKEKILERNLGQDLPILLKIMPSVVTTSDAGAGVGYTSLRIRGSDATRINVTVNGIPLNDSESHGVYWVNMPDFSSSISNIQMQRGVGTSSNGAGAFGATINMQTSNASVNPFTQIENSFGSYQTMKSSIILNTGLINEKFNFEGRLSRINSEGYINRSASDLKSFYLTGGYFGEKTTLKAVVFGGKEVTQQAWYGTPQAVIEKDKEGIENVIIWSGEYNTQQKKDNIIGANRKFNYYLYKNEVDNYSQDHYQLHLNHSFNDFFSASTALHYTYGRGYYEQFREDDDLIDYGLEELSIGDSLITTSDIIRRRWLVNDFYGFTYNLNYIKDRAGITLGGGYNKYKGDHFGEIIWAEHASNGNIRDKYYNGLGVKKDFNVFLKINYQIIDKINLFGDLQLRTLNYETAGVDNDLLNYDTGGDYNFFNPKAGFSFQLNQSTKFYASYAVGNREPVRSDFIDATNGNTPNFETLNNFELGVTKKGNRFSSQMNYYYMGYNNQLVTTGALNDVGSALRVNVPESYRMGIEISALFLLTDQLKWNINATLSENKIKKFTETLYDYAFNYEDERYLIENIYKNTDISFSPRVIIGSDLSFSASGFTTQFLSKYIGRQYLDNTSNNDRIIKDYLVNDIRFSYNFNAKGLNNIGINMMVNNLFNFKYESNGYTWGYLYDGFHYVQNNYYPQAGRNFLMGLSVRF